MFALQEHRSIAGVVSIIVHTGVVAAAIAGARHVGSDTPPIAILADSVWVMPTAGPAGGVAGPAVPLIDPVEVPDIPGMPALPGIPSSRETCLPPTGPGGVFPTGLRGADVDIVDPGLPAEPPVPLPAPGPARPPSCPPALVPGFCAASTPI